MEVNHRINIQRLHWLGHVVWLKRTFQRDELLMRESVNVGKRDGYVHVANWRRSVMSRGAWKAVLMTDETRYTSC